MKAIALIMVVLILWLALSGRLTQALAVILTPTTTPETATDI